MSDTNNGEPQGQRKGALERALEQLSRTVELFRGSRIDIEHWSPAEHGRLVGGQMGGGSIKDGVKHATIMLTITYLAFIFLPQPDVGGTTAGMIVPLLPF